ncbi:MAG: GNAT family N-acetyltransferase [Rhodothermales bacterium]
MPDGTFPTLETKRLVLRQFHIQDARRVQRLAGSEELARSTFLPHPYKNGIAERWILSLMDDFKKDRIVNFAIVLKETDELIGSIGIVLEMAHNRGDLGYWVGMPYWGCGYCTEAGHAVLKYGFDVMALNRIAAPHFSSNPASGRVLQKLGMQHEGTRRQHYYRFGKYEDAEVYGLLKEEYAKKVG